MLQELITYLIVLLSVAYLIRSVFARKKANCCPSKGCSTTSASPLKIIPPEEVIVVQQKGK